MKRSIGPWLGSCLLVVLAPLARGQSPDGPAPAPAADTPANAPDAARPRRLEDIDVQGRRTSDIDERARSTAMKMVFGREELDRYGDTSIGEVLKRLPGITISGNPGRGGDIRMRGLGHGYTQILINGEPTPRGFSFDTLAPEQVERIEILRAPVAEHSARAIAGTINIVLREEFVPRSNEVRVLDTVEQGRSAPGVMASRSDRLDALSYNLNLNVQQRNQANAVRTETQARDVITGQTVLAQSQVDASRTIADSLHFTSRWNWRLGPSDTLNLQPFAMVSRSATPGTSDLDQSAGGQPAPFASARWRTDTDTTIGRMFSDWKHRVDRDTQWTLKLGSSLADTSTTTPETEYDASGAPSHVLLNATTIHDRSFTGGAKLERRIGAADSFVSGWEAEAGSRDESVVNERDGADQLPGFGNDITASTLRLAGYAQDEHRFSALWSGYAGLRWEQIRTASAWGDTSVHNESGVVSPLVHSLWRLSGDDHDQIRFSVTRSYRAPTLNNLVGRPTLSSLYPVSGPNTPTSPDKIGNPGLRPELAWGMDAAFEHYLEQGGILALSAFDRSIDQLMRSSTSLQSVSWSPVERWVNAPANVGHANARGIEAEAKFELGEFFERMPWLELRANYSRFWSSVDQIPGPDNRLDQQPRQTANLGFEFRMKRWPLSTGGNWNWTPAFAVQQSDTQVYQQGRKSVVDWYALWKFSPDLRLRLAASNLLHRDYETANGVTTGSVDQVADALARTYLAWTLRLEARF